MRDTYHMFIDHKRNLGHIFRQHGDINQSTSLFEETGLTADQTIEVNGALIEAYERGFDHALAAMKEYLDRKELNYVRARYESGKDSTDVSVYDAGTMDSHKAGS